MSKNKSKTLREKREQTIKGQLRITHWNLDVKTRVEIAQYLAKSDERYLKQALKKAKEEGYGVGWTDGYNEGVKSMA